MSRSPWLTIVTYHYVRGAAPAARAGYRGPTPADFCGQLDYIGRYYQVVTAGQVMSAVAGGAPLPERAAWLTFDDGYREHHACVLPELLARGWQGTFFPVGRAAERAGLLEVNKIHYLLAAVADARGLVRALREVVEAEEEASALEPWSRYRRRLAGPSQYDGPEAAFVKRMLQRALPRETRTRVLDTLFRRFVPEREEVLARELYMGVEELAALHDAGMCLGCHTWSHPRLTRLSAGEQEEEIDRSLAFLGRLGVPTDRWIIAYPHGDVDDRVAGLVRRKGACIGLTNSGALARLPGGVAMALPRLDTNDLPRDPATSPGLPTVAAMLVA